MLNTTANIVTRGCKAKLDLENGDLAGHVGCAFQVWYDDHKRAGLPAFEQLASQVQAELERLGFRW